MKAINFIIRYFYTQGIGLVMGCGIVFSLYASATTAQIIYKQPVGGKTVTTENICTICWKTTFSTVEESLTLSLWDGRLTQWTTIATNINSSAGTFDWKVPQGISGDRFRIKITGQTSNTTVLTPTFFSIKDKATTTASVRAKNASSVTSSIQVFPNPASNRLSLSWDGHPASLTVRTLLGTGILEKKLLTSETNCSLDISSLQAGSYIIEMQFSDGHQETTSFVINK